MNLVQLVAQEITRDIATLQRHTERMLSTASVDDGELRESINQWETVYKKVGDYKQVTRGGELEGEYAAWYFRTLMPRFYNSYGHFGQKMEMAIRSYLKEERLERAAKRWFDTYMEQKVDEAAKTATEKQLQELHQDLKEAQPFATFEIGQQTIQELEQKISQATVRLQRIERSRITPALAEQAIAILGESVDTAYAPQSALGQLWTLEGEVKDVLARLPVSLDNATKKRTSTRGGSKASKARQQFQPVAAA